MSLAHEPNQFSTDLIGTKLSSGSDTIFEESALSRLSHNLPPLGVTGNQIVNRATGEPIRLRGVNRSGLEYSSPEGAGSLAKAGIDEEEIAEIVCSWKANVIRLPFNQEWALERTDHDPTRYRSALEFVIETAASYGAYTLLDLQWLDNHTVRGTTAEQPNYVAPLPNTNSIMVWQQLSTLWRGETAILYDIFNEPHDKLADDTVPLLGIETDGSTFVLKGSRVGPKEWLPWARHLISAVRAGNPDALIFVPGTHWGYNLKGCIMPDLDDLVYSTHIYPNNGGKHQTAWNRMFGTIAQSVPVFAGEFGGHDHEAEWGAQLIDYFDLLGIGWTAWSWSDHPRLVTFPPSPPFHPTAFGQLVRDRLRVCYRPGHAATDIPK